MFPQVLAVTLLLLSCTAATGSYNATASCSGAVDLQHVTGILTEGYSQAMQDGGAMMIWDLGSISDAQLPVTLGPNSSLQCMVLRNGSLSEDPSKLLQPTAFSFPPGAQLHMQRVHMITSCSTVALYQKLLCSLNGPVVDAVVEGALIHFNSWQVPGISAQDVSVSCEGPENQLPPPPCHHYPVRDSSQLYEAMLHQPTPPTNLTLSILSNTIFANSTSAPATTLIKTTTLWKGDPSVMPVIDFGLHVSLFNISDTAFVELQGLTLVNLAPAYISPKWHVHHFGLLTERVWAFARVKFALSITNVRMVLPRDEVEYMGYWLSLRESPVPEIAARAAWLSDQNISRAEVHGNGIYLASMHALSAKYTNVTFVSSLPTYLRVLPQDLGIHRLLYATGKEVPLSATSQVASQLDLLFVLQSLVPHEAPDGIPYYIYVYNSMGVGQQPGWPPEGQPVVHDTVLCDTNITKLRTVDLGYHASLLQVQPHTTLSILDLTLTGLAPKALTCNKTAALECLVSPLWAVQLQAPLAAMDLEDVRLILPADEVRLLGRAFGFPNEGKDSSLGRFPPDLIMAVQQFVPTFSIDPASNNTHLHFQEFRTARYVAHNVYFVADSSLNSSIPALSEQLQQAAQGQGKARSGSAPWLAAIIVTIVSAAIVAAMIAAVVLYHLPHLHPRWLQSWLQQRLPSSAQSPDPASAINNIISDLERGEGAAMDQVPPLQLCSVVRCHSNDIETLHSPHSRASQDPGQGRSLPTSPRGHDVISGINRSLVVSEVKGSTSSDSRKSSESTMFLSVIDDSDPADETKEQVEAAAGDSNRRTGQPMADEQHGCIHTRLHQLAASVNAEIRDKQLVMHTQLGRGGHGVVFRGVWRGLPVAVKLLVVPADEGNRRQQRGLMEAAISSALIHPNIVTTYAYEIQPLDLMLDLGVKLPGEDSGLTGWRLCIIQEYCDGKSLCQALHARSICSDTQGTDNQGLGLNMSSAQEAASQPSTSTVTPAVVSAEAKILETAFQVASGMQHIHSRKIIHGDLNPNNVLLQTTPQNQLIGYTCKIADFGLSIHMTQDQTHVSNMFQGTPYYIAPEVVLSGFVSQAADVYSFGVMMWELQRCQGNAWRLRKNSTYPMLNPPDLQFHSNCPPGYEDLARRCMEPNKESRPAFAEIVQLLTQMRENLNNQPDT